VLGIQAVGAFAVARDVAGRGGVGEERPRRRIELRQSLLIDAEIAAEGLSRQASSTTMFIGFAARAMPSISVFRSMQRFCTSSMLRTTASTGSR